MLYSLYSYTLRGKAIILTDILASDSSDEFVKDKDRPKHIIFLYLAQLLSIVQKRQ